MRSVCNTKRAQQVDFATTFRFFAVLCARTRIARYFNWKVTGKEPPIEKIRSSRIIRCITKTTKSNIACNYSTDLAMR
eukprot:scaffold501169_cov17-Prasinocladus_malaysianus.AAC.1